MKISGIIKTKITDHFTVFASANCRSERTVNLKTSEFISYRNYGTVNRELFENCLRGVSWEFLYELSTTEEIYDSFYRTVFELFDRCFPLVRKRVKNYDQHKPYIDNNLLALIQEKNRLLKLFNKKPLT